MISTAVRRSLLVDLGFVLVDFVSALLLVRLRGPGTEERMMIVFGIPFLLIVALYLGGLVFGRRGIARGMFRRDETAGMTGILFCNAVLIGAFVFFNISRLGSPFVMFPFLGLFTVLWVLLHRRVVQESVADLHFQSRPHRLAAVLMMLPLMQCMFLFTGAMGSGVANVRDLKGNLLQVLLLVLLTWVLSYVPRKFVKAMLGIGMTEAAFLGMLTAEYAARAFL